MTDIDQAAPEAAEPAAEPAGAPNAPTSSAEADGDEANRAAPPLARFDALVERWFADHFPGSAVAQDTRAWNVAHAALQDLKRRLGALE